MSPTDPQLLTLVLALACSGLAAGLLAGLLGVGGGIVVVPVLYSVLHIAAAGGENHMHVAVATSLALIVPTSVRSALAHHARGVVDTTVLRRWALFVVAGVLLGIGLINRLESAQLSLIFAATVLAVALLLARGSHPHPIPERGVPDRRRQAEPGLATGIGTLSTLMGIGGGTLSVPAMIWCGHPIHRAVGTAAALGLLIAVPGSVGLVLAGLDTPGLPPGSLGYVNLVALFCLLPTTLIAVPWGARLAHRLKPRTLQWLFAAFLALVALRMGWAGLAELNTPLQTR